MAGAAALDGVTVLDLATVGPAARCTRILADYGARVVKVWPPERKAVERPRSEPQASEDRSSRKAVQRPPGEPQASEDRSSRKAVERPPGEPQASEDRSSRKAVERPRSEPQASEDRSSRTEPAWWAYGAGRAMERIRLDLKSDAGRAEFLQRAARADVVVESFRPGVAVRLGIDYETLRRANQGLVYCATSGYGQDGPRAAWAGHDLNYLAVGGYLHLSGRRADGGPALPGATVADAAAGGMQAAIAILAALVRRASTGRGAYLDVAVADGVLSLTALAIDEHLATGFVPGPGRDLLTGRYACYDVYEARDGRWLAVGAIEPAFFANLCRALGLEGLAAHQLDDARQDEIRAAFREAFAKRDRDDWVAELAPADTCVAPVQSVEELTRDAQFRHRGAFVEAEHPEHGRFRQLGPVLAGATEER